MLKAPQTLQATTEARAKTEADLAVAARIPLGVATPVAPAAQAGTLGAKPARVQMA